MTLSFLKTGLLILAFKCDITAVYLVGHGPACVTYCGNYPNYTHDFICDINTKWFKALKLWLEQCFWKNVDTT